MNKTPILIGLILAMAAVPATISAHGACTHGPLVHTYGSGGSAGGNTAATGAVGVGFVIVTDSNAADCDLDGVPGDYDGDLDVGAGGGAFGFGGYAAFCGHDAIGGNFIVSDLAGWPITFWVGADDQAGPLVAGTCLTDGLIDGSNPNDCLHGPYVSTASASPCTGGSDGLVWIFLSGVDVDASTGSVVIANPPTAGTILGY